MRNFDKALQTLVNEAHKARIEGSIKGLHQMMDDLDTAIRGLQGARKQIRKEFPALNDYDRNGRYIGAVRNENGWTP